RALARKADLLAAPDGGRAQLLIDTATDHDVARLEMVPRAGKLLVEATKRGAAIAGNEAPCAQPGRPVEAAAVEGDANQGLDAGEVHDPAFEAVLVVEGDGAGMRGHRFSPIRNGRAGLSAASGRPRRAPARRFPGSSKIGGQTGNSCAVLLGS